MMGWAIVGLIAGCPTAIGETVGMLGDATKLEIRGDTTVPAAAIRWALHCDVDYQSAARPSASRDGFLRTIEDRILQGMHRSGFMQARVDARHDESADRVVIDVDQGPQFTAGLVRVRGSKQFGASWFESVIETPFHPREWTYRFAYDRAVPSKPERTLDWALDGVVHTDRKSRQLLKDLIWYACADAGFPNAETVPIPVVDAESKKVHWDLEFIEEHRPAQIGRITVEGLLRHTEEEVCEFIGLKSGEPFTASLVDTAYQRLRESCRFWSYSLEVIVPAPTNDNASASVDIVVRLEEYLEVPRLDEPLSPVEEALRLCAIRFSGGNSETVVPGKDLTISGSFSKGDYRGEFVGERTSSGDYVATLRSELADVLLANHGISCTDEGVTIYGLNSKQHLILPRSYVYLHITFMPVRNADGSPMSTLKVGFGIRSGTLTGSEPNPDLSAVQLRIEPVAMVRHAHLPEFVASVQDECIVVTNETDTARFVIDRQTGEITDISLNVDEPNGRFTLHSAPRSDETPSLLRDLKDRGAELSHVRSDDSKWLSVVHFLVDELNSQPLAKQDKELGLLVHKWNHWRQSGELDQWVELTFGRFLKEQSIDCDFRIPESHGPGDGEFRLAPFILTLVADASFERGSWPWTIMREAGLRAATHESQHEHGRKADELARIIRDCELGPIAMPFLAVFYSLEDTAAHRWIAKNGALRVSNEEFLKDLSGLLEGDSIVPEVLRSAVAHSNCLAEEELLYLTAGLGNPVRQQILAIAARRREQPDSDPTELLVEHLLEQWEDGWQDQMTSFFHGIAANPVASRSTARNETKVPDVESEFKSMLGEGVADWTAGWDITPE